MPRLHVRHSLTAPLLCVQDSLGNFNDCCLTLQPVKDPVITPAGFLFSKEAILENLLQQKKTIKRKVAAYEAAQEEEKRKVFPCVIIGVHEFVRCRYLG